jgi:predicted metal-dependent hydrolase
VWGNGGQRNDATTGEPPGRVLIRVAPVLNFATANYSIEARGELPVGRLPALDYHRSDNEPSQGDPMSTITVRRMSFEFPESLDDVLPGDDLLDESYLVAFSLTMPALEPYLIRTMRAVASKVTDPQLADDMKAFIGQEAQHFQNHRRVNEMVLRQLGEPAAAQIEQILDRLESDYRRSTDTASDRYNLVYAEGFEAMTCAMAMASFERAANPATPGRFGAWQQLWAWHAAEEIEHRTVAFGAYEHLVGSYPYRVWGSLRAQWHFQRCIVRLQRVVLASRGSSAKPILPPWVRQPDGRRRYLRSFRPGYHPAELEPNALVDAVLAMTTRASRNDADDT